MAGSLTLACLLVAAVARADGILPTRDLHRDGLTAERDCKPLLLEFASTGCSFCHLLETEILNPTLLNQDYNHRVLMRKLTIDTATPLTDFDGAGVVSGRQLAGRYQVAVTPTLLFVDSQGRELAERMVGVTTLELYGGYLDMALDASREKLRAGQRCAG
jgi:thioredoxin-related protein